MRFREDGTFKIMQITDMQEIPAISKDTIALMERAVLEEQPDLVVYTGDQIKGYGVTYKGKGLMVREEYNLPLNEESFTHLKEKIDGLLLQKRRYLIPLAEKYTIELDVFEGALAPLVLAEVEFETEEEANTFVPPEWFGEDVTFSTKYHNSTLSQRTFSS